MILSNSLGVDAKLNGCIGSICLDFPCIISFENCPLVSQPYRLSDRIELGGTSSVNLAEAFLCTFQKSTDCRLKRPFLTLFKISC